MKQFSGGTSGSVRAWHFLADEGADRTKVWKVENGDLLNVLFYEYIDKVQGTATGG